MSALDLANLLPARPTGERIMESCDALPRQVELGLVPGKICAYATRGRPAKKNTKTASTKNGKASKAAKKPAKAKADAKPKRTSALDASVKVLADAGDPMTTKQMTTKQMTTKRMIGRWRPRDCGPAPVVRPSGPRFTSAILRDINEKGKDARFVNT